MHTPTAAGPVLELVVVVHGLGRFLFFILGKVFAFEPLAKFPAAASALVVRLISLDLGGKKSLRQR